MARFRRSKIVVLVLPLALSACAGSDFVNFFKPAKITWNDTSWCTPLQLKAAITKVAKKFGPVRVHSTHRWPIKNYLKSMWEVGGYSYYPRGNFFHIDTGPRRTW